MKKLNKDFKPSEQTYANLRKYGCVPEFVDYELDHFKAYWLDPELPPSKSKKSSWQATCLNWMKRAWKGKAGRDWEYNRHKRSDGGSFNFERKPEIDTKPKPKRRVVIKHSPQYLEMLRNAGQL